MRISAAILSFTLVMLLGSCGVQTQSSSKPAGPTAVREIASTADYEATLKNAPVLLVDFYADWCGPCQTLKPVIAQLSVDYKDQATMVSVDVDQLGDLANRYEVTAIPTILIFEKGKLKSRLEGAKDRQAYESVIKPLVSANVSAPTKGG